ncbi:hypothetical protein ACM3N8_10830 [Aeromonas sp. A04]|uniref:hypothetical protein n=1 Tax=Aeromonas sp. A04 TaxID=3398359 RepID=UPI0039F6906F
MFTFFRNRRSTPPAISLTDDELCTLTWCWRDASRYYSIIHEYPYPLNQARKILADRTRHIQPNTHGDSDWPKLIPHRRREPKAIGL